MDAGECLQFRIVEGTRVPPLRWSWGGEGMVCRSWSSVAPVVEGCSGAMPGCFLGMFPVEGSRCWGIEQAAAVGSQSDDS